MEAKVTKVKVKNIAQSPQKLRLIADLVRGKSVDVALDTLSKKLFFLELLMLQICMELIKVI